MTLIPAKKGKTAKGLTRKYRVAAYCRVSTDSDEQLNSYKNQLEYYTNKISSNPDWEPVEVFAEMLTTTLIQMHPTCTQTAP